jgi:cysteine synthase
VATLGLETEVVDSAVHASTIARFREAGIRLPTFAELASPGRVPTDVTARLRDVGPDDADPANLFRVHWYNDAARTAVESVPGHVVLTEELTGVPSPIVVVFGDRFPMIRAHKVLAAYGCLVPRLVTGQFDPAAQRAVWPSTGNYCRGGVAISRILGCRGVAVLPEGMSAERFRWLEEWVADPADIVRTPGSESNVKEIYDECARLDADPTAVIFNQFCEFGNHLAHVTCTAPALEAAFEAARDERPGLRLAAFVSATGSAGTIGAGDPLKERHGAAIVAAEALECPTLLYNGYGEHNIQGIGDKHVPYIHNVMNTDVVTGITDRATDQLGAVFASEEGRAWLREERGVPADQVAALEHMGFSSLCNVLAGVKTALRKGLGADDAIVTVATDGAQLYGSEIEMVRERDFGGSLDREAAARTFEEFVLGVGDDDLIELGPHERDRVFNLGYFTWVEQQGVELAEFERRRSLDWWRGLRELVPAWDAAIEAFNRETGAAG